MAHPSLQVVIDAAFPKFTAALLHQLENGALQCQDSSGSAFTPGFIGVQRTKSSDALVSVLVALAHLPRLRDFCLVSPAAIFLPCPLLKAFASFVRRLWSPVALRSVCHASELLHAVGQASGGRFSAASPAVVDPLSFCTWLLHVLRRELSAVGNLPIADSFQGGLEILSRQVSGESDRALADFYESILSDAVQSDRSPFAYLRLDLPDTPLFRADDDQPQHQLQDLLREKFSTSGSGSFKTQEGRRWLKKFRIVSAPQYLILCTPRLHANQWGRLEFNQTILMHPVENLQLPDVPDAAYRLRSAVCLTWNSTTESALYKTHLLHLFTGDWYTVDGASVSLTASQTIFLSPSIIQIWERQEERQEE